MLLPTKGRLGEGNVPKLGIFGLIFKNRIFSVVLYSLIAFVSECFSFIEVQMFLSANTNARVLSHIPVRKGKLETIWGM